MDFLRVAQTRYSCRKYDAKREVEAQKLDAILEAGILAPSACNGQPYHITVCRGEKASEVAKLAQDVGINGFASDAPILLVISEKPYVKRAAFGAKIKQNDYRSMDIGILAAYLTAEASSQGLGSCILGWFDGKKIATVCGLDGTVRLLITLGYPLDELRPKNRKTKEELVDFLG
ncbi:MAG: nitroreductase family protein [Clostridia bacterium]|nr:nitroreductase family protein [Clostridia bacterium]